MHNPSSRIDKRLTRPIFVLATSVAFSSQLDTLVGVTDIYLVGDLGPDAIAAVGISQILTMVIGVVMISVSTGAFALVAQGAGANDERTVSATTKQALVLVAAISSLLSLVGITFSRMALNFTLNNCLYGAGDARTPLYLNLFVSVLKIAFSYLLIFGIGPLPNLGVTGAALATVLSRAAGFALSIALVKSN